MLKQIDLVGKVFRPFGFPDGRNAYVYEVEDGVVSFGWQPERGYTVFTTTVSNFIRDFIEVEENDERSDE